MAFVAQWSDEETDDNVLGAGATYTYPWYSGYTQDDDGVTITMLDPETDKWRDYRFRWSRIRTIAREISQDKHGISDRIIGYIKDDDIDADAADCILQVCAFGEVVYS